MKLFRPAILVCCILVISSFTADRGSFENAQRLYPRVGDAYDRKEELILMKCRSKEVSEEFSDIYIRVFKEESIMEVWAIGMNGKYVKFNECKVYAMSGRLGPKRKSGDCQVPEGYYYVNDFNPSSNYHLSLGINYPNQSDLKLTDAANPGGDIYIHGGQASAGCMAMSNYYIEDLYIYAVKARNQGQTRIPVHIYPFKMTAANMKIHTEDPELKKHTAFWNNIAEGYNFFERHSRPADVYIDGQGKYRFSDPRAATANAK